VIVPGFIKEFDILFNNGGEKLHAYPSDQSLPSQCEEPRSEKTSYAVHQVNPKKD